MGKMTGVSHHITYRQSTIHYLRMGNGKDWLFCFHGYGESARTFEMLEPWLGKRFTIIAIDMPFHGETQWNDGLLFEPDALIGLIHFIKPKNIPMHVLGYSMGGRVAMQLLLNIPQEIAKLVLVAPDGLHNNKWQWIATKTWLGNRFFHMCMKYPALTLHLMDFGTKVGIYPKSLQKFVHYYLDDEEQRHTLYKRWTTMRKFSPGKASLRSTINQYKIPVQLLFGKYDVVIVAKFGKQFAEGNEFISVKIIEAGHQLLKPKYLQVIVDLI